MSRPLGTFCKFRPRRSWRYWLFGAAQGNGPHRRTKTYDEREEVASKETVGSCAFLARACACIDPGCCRQNRNRSHFRSPILRATARSRPRAAASRFRVQVRVAWRPAEAYKNTVRRSRRSCRSGSLGGGPLSKRIPILGQSGEDLRPPAFPGHPTVRGTCLSPGAGRPGERRGTHRRSSEFRPKHGSLQRACPNQRRRPQLPHCLYSTTRVRFVRRSRRWNHARYFRRARCRR